MLDVNDVILTFLEPFIEDFEPVATYEPLPLIVLTISLFLSILSLIISARSVSVEKNKFTADNVTKNRLTWMYEVRTHLKEFIDAYESEPTKSEEIVSRKIKLKQTSRKIQLYLVQNRTDYDHLVSAMNSCIMHDKNEVLLDDLLLAAQDVLANVWSRVKAESAMPLSAERGILNRFKLVNHPPASQPSGTRDSDK